MNISDSYLIPDKKKFAADPFGYSALGWDKWGLAQTVAGFPIDKNGPPNTNDLKSPILWLCQARALTVAATTLVRTEQNFADAPFFTRGICHSQYFGVALMLVGYSLEIALKAMLIVKKGIEEYSKSELQFKHHNLRDLADFIPNLSTKDIAILTLLTHYVKWAGRYPDPGKGREHEFQEIFAVSEQHEITAKDLFNLSSRVMSYATTVVG